MLGLKLTHVIKKNHAISWTNAVLLSAGPSGANFSEIRIKT